MYVHIILYLMYVYICIHIWVHILHVYMYIYIDKYIYMYMYHTYIYVCRYMRMIVASYKDRSKPRFCPPGSARGSHIFACMKLHFRVWQRILIEFEIGWSKPLNLKLVDPNPKPCDVFATDSLIMCHYEPVYQSFTTRLIGQLSWNILECASGSNRPKLNSFDENPFLFCAINWEYDYWVHKPVWCKGTLLLTASATKLGPVQPLFLLPSPSLQQLAPLLLILHHEYARSRRMSARMHREPSLRAGVKTKKVFSPQCTPRVPAHTLRHTD